MSRKTDMTNQSNYSLKSPFMYVESNGCIGLEKVTPNGRITIVPTSFYSITTKTIGDVVLFIVFDKALYGVYDSNGNLIMPVAYKKISIVGDTIRAALGKGNTETWYAFDLKGNSKIL